MSSIKGKSVFVAMSGGVDSSIAALLLKKQGYDVTGVFMRCYNIDGCAERDAEDARRVAEKIGIPFYSFDFEEEYKRDVVNYMVEGYRAGITPNPDVMCNKVIKFGLFLKKAKELGADYIATGHYVRLRSSVSPRTDGSLTPAVSDRLRSQPQDAEGDQALAVSESSASKHPNTFYLSEAKDKNKDQSYFLWTLTQEQLQHCLFPIGDYLKSEVREIAKEAGLPTAEKKDSQGICFLGQVTLDEFLRNYIPEKRGEVFTTTGKKIGEHEGAHFYTIGQRHGLNLDTKNKELGALGAHKTEPHYVTSKDVATNTVTVAEGADNPDLFRSTVMLSGLNFISEKPEEAMDVSARVRYRQPRSNAILTKQGEQYSLVFENPQKFVAEGQSAVFYDDDGRMIGGGVIV